MPSFKVPELSPEEKRFQTDLQWEQELVKLRREYVVLSDEQTRTQLHGFAKLNKGAKIFNIFKGEYQNIVTDLHVAAAPGNHRKDTIQYNYLSDLLKEYNEYNNDVKIQKTYIKELEGQITEVQKHVHALCKEKNDRSREHEVFAEQASHVIEALENKLEVQMKKFNMIAAKNFELKKQVDHLLWDRENFMGVFRKLIDKLNTGKHIMLDLIEQASLAYDQREEWCTRLQMLRTKAHKDLVANIDRMREYQQEFANRKKLEEFYSIKGQKRIMFSLIHKEKIKRYQLETKLEGKLKSYREMMHEIKEFTKQTEVNVLIRVYHQQEAENFSKFTNIIDAIRETESMNDDLGFLHLDIDEQRLLLESRADQQKTTLEDLETRLEECTQSSTRSEEELGEVRSNLEELITGVSTLFALCKCDQDPLLELLDDNTSVTQFNILLYLQILEKTIHDYLIRVYYKEKIVSEKKPSARRIFSKEPSHAKIYNIDTIVTDHPCALCLEHELVSDVVDVVVHAWSRTDAMDKLQERLKIPGALTYVHRLSNCHLPQSRRIMQQRYE